MTVAGGRVLWNADHAFNATHDTPDNTAYDAANYGTDRAGGSLTYGHALLTSSDNALSLCSDGR
jgi:hypothetical protein